MALQLFHVHTYVGTCTLSYITHLYCAFVWIHSLHITDSIEGCYFLMSSAWCWEVTCLRHETVPVTGRTQVHCWFQLRFNIAYCVDGHGKWCGYTTDSRKVLHVQRKQFAWVRGTSVYVPLSVNVHATHSVQTQQKSTVGSDFRRILKFVKIH